MLTLGNMFVLMLLATGAAWVWHNHGLRERALARVKQHCAKLDIELLDGELRNAQGPNLSGLHGLGHRADAVFDVDLGIGTVQVIQIDVVDAQPSERVVDGRP